ETVTDLEFLLKSPPKWVLWFFISGNGVLYLVLFLYLELRICKIPVERRAFLFRQQDRAILCRDCDVMIHKANEYPQKHSRFFLTGVKLSAKKGFAVAGLGLGKKCC
ncbi:hypothetical protein U1Q18_038848, partial [Sarracenia purpurea var. burkii]